MAKRTKRRSAKRTHRKRTTSKGSMKKVQSALKAVRAGHKGSTARALKAIKSYARTSCRLG